MVSLSLRKLILVIQTILQSLLVQKLLSNKIWNCMTVRINISTRNKVNARKGPNKLCKCESDLQNDSALFFNCVNLDPRFITHIMSRMVCGIACQIFDVTLHVAK